MDFTTNNCGMYWSDGSFQSSVGDFTTDPVNELDASCLEHDRSYNRSTTQHDYVIADDKFYETNYGKSFKRTTYALLVKHGNKAMRFGFLNPFSALEKYFGIPSKAKFKDSEMSKPHLRKNDDSIFIDDKSDQGICGIDNTKIYDPSELHHSTQLGDTSSDTSVYGPIHVRQLLYPSFDKFVVGSLPSRKKKYKRSLKFIN